MALSSMALIRNNEIEFVKELDNVKQEEEYELKAYVLYLYYVSKNNNALAMKYYNNYSRCTHENRNIEIVMKYLFNKDECLRTTSEFQNAINSFQNPAIIRLLKDNDLL